jgi:ABC-2 type transport system permease protein
MATLYAEWTKLRTVRSTTWSLVAIVALTLVVSALVSSGTSTNATISGDDDVIEISLSGVFMGQVAVVAIGVLAVTSEYATRMIRTTFLAVPGRRGVIAAKAAIVACVVFAGGLLASAAAFLLGQAVLHGNGYVAPAYPPVTLADGPALRAVLGSALFLTAIALLGLGMGVILRHTAAAISALLGLLFAPLVLSQFLSANVREIVLSAVPSAGIEIQSTVARADNLPVGPWGGLAVTFAWSIAALLAAFWLIGKRDA